MAIRPSRYDRGEARRGGVDLLRLPLVGQALRWRHARTAMQLVCFVIAGVLVAHGLFGPRLAPKNLSTLVTWVHYRGLLVFVLLAAGNFFCMGCPLLLPRELARRFAAPARRFPRRLRSKYPAVVLFAGVLFAYELFDLWGSPVGTALLILLYFAAALVVDALFRGAPFCKYVCPIGQFNFVASTLSPFEVGVRDLDTCATCRTKDCIRGVRDAFDRPAGARGCELALYLPRKHGNVDCTFCLDCVHACPHDNVAIATRLPGEELVRDPLRAGVGRLLRRRDWAVLVILFTFGGLLNAFGMVPPVYELIDWLADALGTRREWLVLGLVFAASLVALPALLVGAATWLSRRLGAASEPGRATWVRHAFGLAPLGVGVWLAHYSFHFLTGLYTIVPVLQAAVRDAWLPVLGEPMWTLGGIEPAYVWPLELGFLALGAAGSVAVTLSLSRGITPGHRRLAALPWVALVLALAGTAIWLMSLPMEMRGTML